MDTVKELQTPQLVEDVRYWAEWVMAQAEAQIGECYPVDADGAVPVAYLWAKTIVCPHCGGEVPLIKRRWLDTQGDEPVAYRLIVDREAKTNKAEILRGQAAVDSEPERGTMRGATVECPYCGTPTERERIAEQGRAGQMRDLLAEEDDEYARAVALYLDFVLAKQVAYNSTAARWQPASWGSFINALWRSIENAAALDTTSATVRLGSATELSADWTGHFDAIRYPRVEWYDGSRVDVSDFLDLVRHEVAAFAIERIVGGEGFSERLDQPTQFYLLWRWGYGEWDVPDGEAVLLSTAVGIDLGVLIDRVGLVGKVKGKLRLLSPAARATKLERVVDRVAAGGAVPLVDVLHAACLLWQADRQEDMAALVAARGGELWPVAQAIVELLSRDHAERKVLMSLLGTRVDLEHCASRWAETHRREAKPEVKQLGLWGEDE
jgi:sarcosine oxidase delta subunit